MSNTCVSLDCLVAMMVNEFLNSLVSGKSLDESIQEFCDSEMPVEHHAEFITTIRTELLRRLNAREPLTQEMIEFLNCGDKGFIEQRLRDYPKIANEKLSKVFSTEELVKFFEMMCSFAEVPTKQVFGNTTYVTEIAADVRPLLESTKKLLESTCKKVRKLKKKDKNDLADELITNALNELADNLDAFHDKYPTFAGFEDEFEDEFEYVPYVYSDYSNSDYSDSE